jgi:histidine triad (HIT) family protein
LAVAGFDVPHAHVHVIPLHDYHDLTSKRLLEGTLTKANKLELADNAQRILAAMHGDTRSGA